jgi:predicted O-methyltransferase YrrM
VVYLWTLLVRAKPRRIVEFGSGLSTRIFATYARRMAHQGLSVRVLSVEHDQGWLEKTRGSLLQAGDDDWVETVHAPLREQRLLGRAVVAYNTSQTDLRRQGGASGFDMCFIDGPPGTVGRVGSLALAARYLADGSYILLDDAYRSGEQAALREWHRNYRDHLSRIRLVLVDHHGLAVARWKS